MIFMTAIDTYHVAKQQQSRGKKFCELYVLIAILIPVCHVRIDSILECLMNSVLRFGAIVTVSVMVAACGGGNGGVQSTPPPTSGPAPTPSPAPTPAPTPTPPEKNDDLLAPVVSEVFTNDAMTNVTTVETEVSGTENVRSEISDAELMVTYDDSTQKYILQYDGVGQSFGAADITEQTDATTTYQVTNSDGSTNTLVLTNPGADGGSLNYQYVGAGEWFRSINVNPDPEGKVDRETTNSFTYGIETENIDVPRTGSANYAVELIASARNYSYSGTGVFTADFGSGQFGTDIDVTEQDLINGTSEQSVFSGRGDLSASTGQFSGTFNMAFAKYGVDSIGNDEGTLSGRFYGPGAAELGASFSAVRPFGEVIVGTILGRKDENIAGLNRDIIDIDYNQDFLGQANGVTFAINDVDGTAPRNSAFAPFLVGLRYDAVEKSYTTYGDFEFIRSPFTADQLVEGTPQFIIYDQGFGSKLYLYRTGNENPDIALSYASFAILEHTQSSFTQDGVGQPSRIRRAFLPYGIETKIMPKTGSATYSGLIYGNAVSDKRVYDLSGESSIAVDFGSGSVTGTLNPIGTETESLTVYDFGNFNFTATNNSASNAYNGKFLGASGLADNGYIFGLFFGPEADETVATFNIKTKDPIESDANLTINGVTVGKKD